MVGLAWPSRREKKGREFFYGQDEDIQHNIRLFCTQNITSIRETVLASLQFDSDAARDGGSWKAMIPPPRAKVRAISTI